MTHRRKELRLRATRGFGGGKPARITHRTLLGVFSLREIARHLREPEQLTLRVEERGDDDIRPEARSIFPNPPAFVLETPLARGHLQLPRWLAALDVLLGIEVREVASDDLSGLVAFDPARAFV